MRASCFNRRTCLRCPFDTRLSVFLLFLSAMLSIPYNADIQYGFQFLSLIGVLKGFNAAIPSYVKGANYVPNTAYKIPI